MSDPTIDGKICKGGIKQSDSPSQHGGACGGGTKSSKPSSWSQNDPGLERALSGMGEGKWPMISVGTTSAATADGSGHVASDIASLTKDEKVKVAGHRDVFSSYNRDSKM